MANIKIEITDADVNRALQKTFDQLGDLRAPLEAFGEYLLTETRGRFDREQGPDGLRWLDISPQWREQKQREGRPTQVGVYTRQLRDLSLSYKATGRSLIFGSAAEHAPFFQFGTRYQDARPFLGISSQDRQELLSTLIDSFGQQ